MSWWCLPSSEREVETAVKTKLGDGTSKVVLFMAITRLEKERENVVSGLCYRKMWSYNKQKHKMKSGLKKYKPLWVWIFIVGIITKNETKFDTRSLSFTSIGRSVNNDGRRKELLCDVLG